MKELDNMLQLAHDFFDEAESFANQLRESQAEMEKLRHKAQECPKKTLEWIMMEDEQPLAGEFIIAGRVGGKNPILLCYNPEWAAQYKDILCWMPLPDLPDYDDDDIC